MRGGDKAYRIYSLVKDGGDSREYLFAGHFTPFRIIPADLDILAIDALEVAMRKKDIANPLIARDDGFLAFMNADGCNIEAIAAVAVTIVAAFPG